MKVFVRRGLTGLHTSELEDLRELTDLLEHHGLRGDDDEVTAEITAPWHFICGLLSHPMFSDIWFRPEEEE